MTGNLQAKRTTSSIQNGEYNRKFARWEKQWAENFANATFLSSLFFLLVYLLHYFTFFYVYFHKQWLIPAVPRSDSLCLGQHIAYIICRATQPDNWSQSPHEAAGAPIRVSWDRFHGSISESACLSHFPISILKTKQENLHVVTGVGRGGKQTLQKKVFFFESCRANESILLQTIIFSHVKKYQHKLKL